MILDPTLVLTDAFQACHLHIHETKVTKKGVGPDILGPWNHYVVNLSRLLDPISSSWSTYLRPGMATSILVKEAEK